MKRKDYQKPAMLVVKLKHKTHLLQVSGENVKATTEGEFMEHDI